MFSLQNHPSKQEKGSMKAKKHNDGSTCSQYSLNEKSSNERVKCSQFFVDNSISSSKSDNDLASKSTHKSINNLYEPVPPKRSKRLKKKLGGSSFYVSSSSRSSMDNGNARSMGASESNISRLSCSSLSISSDSNNCVRQANSKTSSMTSSIHKFSLFSQLHMDYGAYILRDRELWLIEKKDREDQVDDNSADITITSQINVGLQDDILTGNEVSVPPVYNDDSGATANLINFDDNSADVLQLAYD